MRALPVIGVSVVFIGVSLAVSAGQPAQPVSLETVLGKASWYALDFIDQFSKVVAEEHYIQDSQMSLPAYPLRMGRPSTASTPMGRARHRELKSDFLLVKVPNSDWQPFRDVFEVDHVPVRDREERLSKLFLDPSAGNLERAGEIQEESTRYNLGAVQRTINNPVFPLLFLQPDYHERFRFTLGKQDRRAGENVWIVEYVEEERPTLIRGRPGEEMPAQGRFWIDVVTGHVVKVELVVKRPDITANLTTTFRPDSRFTIELPAEMHEDYDLLSNRLTGVATYGRYRQFKVTAEHDITPPQ